MEVLKKDLKRLKIPLIAVIIYCVIMQVTFGTVCPIKALFNYPCPACGLTHATIYLLLGDFKKAIESNATVFLWLISIMLLIIDRYIHKLKINVFPLCFTITGLITIIWYFIRNFL